MNQQSTYYKPESLTIRQITHSFNKISGLDGFLYSTVMATL